jgi:hypothetical protein
VRTGRRLGGIETGQLVQQPVGGGAKALLVLLAVREKVSGCIFFLFFFL